MEYSKRLGSITAEQFQAALDHFALGRFIAADPIPFGLFGQNVFLTSTAGEFVLRGAPHSDWQLPKERFFAELIHERTTVPAPWPYALSSDESTFGWRYGYAVLPRMPGLQLADDEVLKALSAADRRRIAHLLGRNLRELQRATWEHAGGYDPATGTIRAFDGGFPAWLIGEFRSRLRECISYGTGATEADRDWAERLIGDAGYALECPGRPVLVLHDYKEGNLTVHQVAGAWRVGGVFDLVEALFGDGELDLVRQLALYLDEDVHLAAAFLAGYRQCAPLRAGAAERLALFMAYDRTVIWEYWHRPEHLRQWGYDARTPREWIRPYLAALETLLA